MCHQCYTLCYNSQRCAINATGNVIIASYVQLMLQVMLYLVAFLMALNKLKYASSIPTVEDCIVARFGVILMMPSLKMLHCAYNRIFGIVMKLETYVSMSGKFVENNVGGFKAVWRKFIFAFRCRILDSSNDNDNDTFVLNIDRP